MRDRISDRDPAPRCLHWLALAAVTSLIASAAWSDPTWKTFSSKQRRFCIEMPLEPVETETQQLNLNETAVSGGPARTRTWRRVRKIK